MTEFNIRRLVDIQVLAGYLDVAVWSKRVSPRPSGDMEAE